ncbi:MAG: CotH kinase family protein [Silvibacterium sp.]
MTVTVNSGDNDSDNFTGPVVVTLTGLPSGITVAPITLTAGSSGVLNLSASVSAGQEGFPTTGTSFNTSWTAQATLVGAAGSVQITSPFALTISISNPSYAPINSAINLPIVKIDTGGVPVTSKTIDVPGTITITSADGQTSYLPNSKDSDDTATFHVHGNSTAGMPKLPYHVKLNTSLDLLDTMGLTCPYVTNGSGKAACDKSKSFILLANYDDKTFLRDWSASALANAIPYGGDYLTETPVPSSYSGTIPTPSGTSALMPWAPHSLFVELYLNGVYEGNYQLIEEVKVDSHRVNITELSESDTSPSQVTGGYLMEIDPAHEDEAYDFHTPQNVVIGLIDPDFTPDPEVPEQTSYITNYVDNAENALFSTNFTDPTVGWRAYFDEASAINFYIVNDVMGNVDGGLFYSSDYLYKDQNNPFIYMGPIWDFDISSGNINYHVIVNPTVPWMQAYAPWYLQWFKDPGFNADVVKQWNTLKNNGVFTTWLASIQQQAATLEQSQANNFERWPMQGIEVWPNAEAAGSYNGEVTYFTNWLTLRIAYLDSVFNNKTQTSTTLTLPGGTMRDGTTATLSASVSGKSSLSGTVSFLENGILLGTTELAGNSASLTTSNLPVGADSFEAIYSGDSQNGLSASNPQSVTVASPLIRTVTSLATSSADLNQITPTSFTVSVIGSSGAVPPTGTVTFTADDATLGSAPLLANGTASLSSLLPVGADSITAVYSGDTNYQGSNSNVISVGVIGIPDFSLTASPSLAEIYAGAPVEIALTLTPQYGFNQAVSFACSGQNAGVSCSFSPATVTPGSASITSTMTVSFPGSTQQASLPLWSRVSGGIVVALLLWPFRRRRLRLLLAIVAMLAVGFSISACGTSPTSAAYQITITASGGGITHTASVNLVGTTQ